MLCHVTLSYTVLCSQAGETALHVTARYGYPDVLAFLCQSGAKLNIQDNVSPQAFLLLSHSTLISPSSPYHLSLSSSPLPSLSPVLSFSPSPLSFSSSLPFFPPLHTLQRMGTLPYCVHVGMATRMSSSVSHRLAARCKLQTKREKQCSMLLQ